MIPKRWYMSHLFANILTINAGKIFFSEGFFVLWECFFGLLFKKLCKKFKKSKKYVIFAKNKETMKKRFFYD